MAAAEAVRDVARRSVLRAHGCSWPGGSAGGCYFWRSGLWRVSIWSSTSMGLTVTFVEADCPLGGLNDTNGCSESAPPGGRLAPL